MADEPEAGTGQEAATETPEQRRARGYKNLRPPLQPGCAPLNPKGINGHRKRQELIAAILDEEDDDGPVEPGCSRIRSVVLSTVKLAKNIRAAAAAGAQKTCIEQYAGKARAQLDVSNEDASLMPAMLRVLFTTSELSSGAGKVELVGVEAQDSTGLPVVPDANKAGE